MKKYIFFVIILCSACSQQLTVPIIGTWRCEAVERIEANVDQNMAKSLGQEMAISEKVSDTLVLRANSTYDEFISAFGIHNQINGTYLFSANDQHLKLSKNSNAAGTERIKEFKITKLTTDTLILNDNKGFRFIYLRLTTN